MGVKDLWTILSSLSDRRPLYELEGKAIAIDLSCWVVECQNVTDNNAQPKMYLRNLFFRTSNLLLQNIFPVFVLEGEAPALKHKTIARRNETRNLGEVSKTKKKTGRTNFNYVLRECQEMLKYMGIACVKGQGEAEAMCARLNEAGLVAGCISQDSDCFLYGAKVVYRNFCTTNGGFVDQYSMNQIQDAFQIGRNHMVALALICGCDYDEGVSGVGKESALKLFKTIGDSEILDRMKQWRTNISKFERMELEISNPNICQECGHSGKKSLHTRRGCEDCGTTSRCSSDYKEKRASILNELTIRKKALLVENFPNQELIDEFLNGKSLALKELDLKWKKPMVVDFIAFMDGKGLWDPDYAFKKIFPLMTRWQILNLKKLPIDQRLTMPGVFVPEKIVKIRNVRSVASYQILWTDANGILEGLVLVQPNSDNENENEESSDALPPMDTIEPQELVRNCYPDVVQAFEDERNAKKKRPTRSRKKKTVEEKETEENGERPKEKNKREKKKRRKSKTVEVANNRKIVDFVTIRDNSPTLEEALGRMSITPSATPKRRKKESRIVNYPSVKKRDPQIERIMTTERMDEILNGSLEVMFNELTPEDFEKCDDIDLSDIIKQICSRKTSSNVVKKLEDVSPKMPRERRNSVEIIYEDNSFGERWQSFDRQLEIQNMENMSPNRNVYPLNRSSEKKNKSILVQNENSYRRRSTKKEIASDSSSQQESSLLKDDSDIDEFDAMLKTFVPLDKRLQNNKKSVVNLFRHSSLCDENEETALSIGIDSILNGTD